MFDDHRKMRSTTQVDLKNALKVDIPIRNIIVSNVAGYFLDGCAILWAIEWPTKNMPIVQDFIDEFRQHISSHYLKHADVYLAFDRYIITIM